MQEYNQNNYQNADKSEQVNPYQGQPQQPYQGQPQQPYQGQPQQPYQGQPQQPYQGQPQQPYQGQPQQPYQGQPQQPYQGQPGQQYQTPYTKPKSPNVFSELFKKIFSDQPYDAFKVKQDFLSIFIFIGAAILLVALAVGINSTTRFYFNFIVYFIIAFLGMVIVYGIQLGYGLLMQGKAGTSNQKLKAILEVSTTSTIVSLPFYFLSFLFSFFWHTGFNIFLLAGFVINIVLFLDGIAIRASQSENVKNMWFKVGFVFVMIILYRFTTSSIFF